VELPGLWSSPGCGAPRAEARGSEPRASPSKSAHKGRTCESRFRTGWRSWLFECSRSLLCRRRNRARRRPNIRDAATLSCARSRSPCMGHLASAPGFTALTRREAPQPLGPQGARATLHATRRRLRSRSRAHSDPYGIFSVARGARDAPEGQLDVRTPSQTALAPPSGLARRLLGRVHQSPRP